MKSVLSVHWKDWCWSWNSNTVATWWEELTHLKRPWYWERLMTGGEGDDRGWYGWMASPTRWTWVWIGSGRWWWTRKPGMLQSMRSQRVGRDWTELNWWILSVTILLWCFSNDDFIFHSILPHLLLGILLIRRTVPTLRLTYSVITIYP